LTREILLEVKEDAERPKKLMGDFLSFLAETSDPIR